jgi:hypothetical protein
MTRHSFEAIIVGLSTTRKSCLVPFHADCVRLLEMVKRDSFIATDICENGISWCVIYVIS